MMIVAIHEPGYDINRKNSDLWLGNRPYIQMILTPTVPIIESIIGTVEYPIPLSAPGKRSMIPHRKYGIVVIEIISSPDLITSLLLVYMPSICVPNMYEALPITSATAVVRNRQSISTLSILFCSYRIVLAREAHAGLCD